MHMLQRVFSTTQHSAISLKSMRELSMLSNDSQSIIVGVAMILVLEWVTQDTSVKRTPLTFTGLTRDTSSQNGERRTRIACRTIVGALPACVC